MAASHMRRIVQQMRQALLGDDGCVPDGQLLECFLASQEQMAFEALLRRHGRMVLGVCQRVLHNAHDAEDAFQATFLVLIRKAATLLGRPTIGDWLYGVAYHTALKARAANLKRRAKEGRVSAMPREEPPSPDLWRELQPLLDRELHRLPSKYRRPVVLCDLEGRTRKEAAAQLGWPEGTVSGRLARARVLLAKRLTRQGVTLSGGLLGVQLAQHAASAGVPSSLIAVTTQAAVEVAAGQAVAACAVSANVAALTGGVLKGMALAKVKAAVFVLVVLGLVGSGAGVAAWQLTAASSHLGTPAPRADSAEPAERADSNPTKATHPETTDAALPKLLPPALLAKVPRAVLEAVLTRFPGAELLDADRETEEGKTVYNVALKHQGQDMEVTLSLKAKITLIEKETMVRDLPQPVVQALESQYPKAKIKKIEAIIKVENQVERLICYEVMLVTAKKKTLVVGVSPEGQIVHEEK